MKDDFVAAILHFFNTKRMLKSLNLSTLTLIPKIKVPERLEDYRPISCLGITYKVFSKILTARLMTILPRLVSENQLAFIKGRRISDAIARPRSRVHPSFQLQKHIEEGNDYHRLCESF